jgi:hypothetical protein
MPGTALQEMIAATPFIDTHEHLLEESTRLRGAGTNQYIPCTDAALLLRHYAGDDLLVAGMPAAARERFYAPEVDPEEKWRLLAPYWLRCRTTGYLQAVRWTVRCLFGENDLDAASFVRVSERIKTHARPGFYRDVFKVAGVESCQVNSFEAIFCESAQPDLLLQDLNIGRLAVAPDLSDLQATTGITAARLEDMHAIIDWYFSRYGARAVAVKNGVAYQRRLHFAAVGPDTAGPLFARHAQGERLTPDERTALEDHLMHYCIARATEHVLPVKIHCGYFAGTGGMPLERVRQNAADLCPLLQAYPETPFVLMHIGYPYQDEYIALAKHYPNAYVDLCWAWIVNPAATVRFVREFLVAAPASKLFTFGGDYSNVEPIVGHARIARLGLEQALAELVAAGWLAPHEALALVEPLMRGNALRVFKLGGGNPSRTGQPGLATAVAP